MQTRVLFQTTYTPLFTILISLSLWGCAGKQLRLEPSSAIEEAPSLSQSELYSQARFFEPMSIQPVSEKIKKPVKLSKIKGKKNRNARQRAALEKPIKATASSTTSTPLSLSSSIPLIPWSPRAETSTYAVTWMGIRAAEMQVQVNPEKLEGVPYIRLKSHVKTTGALSLFFKADDTFQSFIDTTQLLPFKSQRQISESNLAALGSIFFQSREAVIYAKKMDKSKNTQEERKTVPLPEPHFDETSILYAIRALNYRNQAEIKIPFIETSGKQKEALLRFVERQTVKTDAGTFPAQKIAIQVVDRGGKTGPNGFAWISDDEQRLILKLEAHVRIGTVFIHLREHSL